MLRRIIVSLRFVLIIVIIAVLLAPEWSVLASEENRLRGIVGLQEYDFLAWETGALADKGSAVLAAGQLYLDESTRKEIVLGYLELVRQAERLEANLDRFYTDPSISDPAQASADDQQQLAAIRAQIAEKQPLAEAIVQEQVATILSEEGFDAFGQAWPPVLMRVTPLPSLLVVSPREHIEQIYQVSLNDGLNTADKERLEAAVVEDLGRSALVVPLGGIGTYPAMIGETSDINRLAEVVAHEWTHHWLTLKPLGLSYFLDSDVRIINETVASLVDQELGRQVVARYYPEFVPPVAEPSVQEAQEAHSAEPAAFDFQQELAQTRIEAEKLLEQGLIEEAELYMESRRRDFLDEGYQIRKLNQAFFAFYGAYAAEPGGAQGGNPIGPMLSDIRAHSPSTRAFLDNVATITSFDDLQQLHERLVPPSATER